MANSIAILSNQNSSTEAIHSLDVDTGTDAQGICWAGNHNGSLFFYVLLRSAARPLKLYRVDSGALRARFIQQFNSPAGAATFYGITTDGRMLYILCTIAEGSPSVDQPYILAVNRNAPGQQIEKVACGTTTQIPTDITFDGVNLWWGLYSLTIPTTTYTLRNARPGNIGAQGTLPYIAHGSLEHDGANRFHYMTFGGLNLGTAYKYKANQIHARALSTGLTNNTMCRAGHALAIVGA